MNEQDKRNLAMARTLLFNYGQGLWTPFCRFRECCTLLGISPRLSASPNLSQDPCLGTSYSWSFFSKMFCFYPDVRQNRLILYDWFEADRFLRQPTAAKLNWLRNFSYAQELLFNFSAEDMEKILNKLLKHPRQLVERLPFSLEAPHV